MLRQFVISVSPQPCHPLSGVNLELEILQVIAWRTPHFVYSIIETPKTAPKLSNVEKPASRQNDSNSFSVLSLPPDVTDSINMSKLTSHCSCLVISGDSGRMPSMTMTFPFIGSAFQQFFSTLRQCSSLQS